MVRYSVAAKQNHDAPPTSADTESVIVLVPLTSAANRTYVPIQRGEPGLGAYICIKRRSGSVTKLESIFDTRSPVAERRADIDHEIR